MCDSLKWGNEKKFSGKIRTGRCLKKQFNVIIQIKVINNRETKNSELYQIQM